MSNHEIELLKKEINQLKQKVEILEDNQDDNSVVLILATNDYDKAMSAMTLATGAAAMGMKVTVFFTFWGINLLKKENRYKNKNLVQKGMTMMMPEKVERNPLSKFQMLGMGKLGMKYLMRKKDICTLADLMQLSQELEVAFFACEMTMNLMGISREELIENLTYCGAAECLDNASKASISYFI